MIMLRKQSFIHDQVSTSSQLELVNNFEELCTVDDNDLYVPYDPPQRNFDPPIYGEHEGCQEPSRDGFSNGSEPIVIPNNVGFGSVTKSMSLPSSTKAPPGQFSELCAFIPSCVSSRLCQSSMPLLTDYDDQPDIVIPIEEQPSLNSLNYPEKLSLKFFNTEKSYQLVDVDKTTRVADVCERLVHLNNAGYDPSWSVVQRFDKLQLERSLEDHELICEVDRTHNSDNEHRFCFRKDFTRYELFRHPNQFFPENMVHLETLGEEPAVFLTKYEKYKHSLLQNLKSDNCSINIHGYLHMREKGRKQWKKNFFVLRGSGLYYSTKPASTDPRYLVLISHLADDCIYIAHNSKKVFAAPTDLGFCLKNSRESIDSKQLQLFCAEDEQSRLCWIAGLRLVKFGSRIRENYQVSVKIERQFKNKEFQDNQLNSLFTQNLVPMDFSGDKGRVVVNASEALGIAYEQTHKLRVEASRSLKVESQSSRTSTGSMSFAESIHLFHPWFHGRIRREEAVKVIEEQGLVNGVFLIRVSRSIPGAHVLSFAHNHKVKHIPIHKVESDDGQLHYSLDNGATKFMDLIQLVDFYQLNAGILPIHLTHHVTKIL